MTTNTDTAAPMTAAERRAAVALLERAWTPARYLLVNKAWHNHAARLLALATKEEKDHRKGGASFVGARYAVSVATVARFYALKRLAEYLDPAQKRPTPGDMITMQPSAAYAAGLVDLYGDDIARAFPEEDRAAVLALDYSRLVGD